VQGEGAAEEIADAIRLLGGSGAVDVLIAGRGGGSIEDLWAFNEEVVARAVADAPIPVISAVGHEVDVTISDLVADLRAATPSAAAEAVAPDKEEILRMLSGARSRLGRGLRQGVERRKLLAREGSRALRRIGAGMVEARRVQVVAALEEISRAMREKMTLRRGRLATVSGRIDALSPLSVLKRGFAVPQDLDGRVLRGVADFSRGITFRLRVADGRILCETKDTELGHPQEARGE
jgi:exodeoxyribonuclease VII large subunit